jgi:hypothetical protein
MQADSSEAWQPLFVRDTSEAAAFEALVDGVPYWLERSLWRWVMDRAVGGAGLLNKAERQLRIQIPAFRTEQDSFDNYWAGAGDQERLTLIDFLLHDLEDRHRAAVRTADNSAQANVRVAVAQLDWMLTEGGSLWRAMFQPHWGLARRVNEASEALAERVASPSSDAARKIASARSACYRHDPNYDLAYRDAVLAVEAALLPLVLSRSTQKTLGTALAHIRDTADRWNVGGLDAEEIHSGPRARVDAAIAVAQPGTTCATRRHDRRRHPGRSGDSGHTRHNTRPLAHFRFGRAQCEVMPPWLDQPSCLDPMRAGPASLLSPVA